MTDNEFVQRVAKSDPETWKTIQATATEQGKKATEVAEELKKIYDEPFFATLPEGDRLLYTAKVFLSRLNQGLLIQSEPYELFVLSKSAVKEFTKEIIEGGQKVTKTTRVGNVYAIGRHAERDTDPVRFTIITLFNEDVDKHLNNVQVNQTYLTKLGGGATGEILQLKTAPATSFSEPVKDAPALNPKEIIEKIFTRVPLAEIKDNISQDPKTDYKLVRGNVIFSNVKSGISKKNGKPYSFGSYSIFDNSLGPAALKQNRAFQISCDPPDVKYGGGAELYFIGPIKADPKYGPKMEAACIIPIFAYPKTVTTPTTATAPAAKEAEAEDEFGEFDENAA